MFGTFVIGIIGFYVVYYVAMISVDMYASNKMEQEGSTTKEVDISEAVAGYKATDVRGLLEEEAEEPVTDAFDPMGEGEAVEEPDENAGGFEAEYGLSDPSDFLPNEYEEGIKVKSIQEMFIENSKTPSLFEGIKFPA